MCFGTFDIIHDGHKFYLNEAKKFGDELVVVVARDDTVVEVKKQNTKYNEATRLQHLKDLHIADKVILGNKDDKLQVIEDEKPEIVCLGYDQVAFTHNLAEKLIERHLHGIKIIRLASHHPDKFKSSLLRESENDNS